MNNGPTTAPNGTEQIGVTHPVRITCDCRTCGGRVAWTRQSALDKGATQHGLVALAYGAAGRFQRAVLRDEA
jgi:hypothetical protein